MSGIILSKRQQYYLQYFKVYQKAGVGVKKLAPSRIAVLASMGGPECKFECTQCGESFKQSRGLGRDDKAIKRHLIEEHGIDVPQFGGLKSATKKELKSDSIRNKNIERQRECVKSADATSVTMPPSFTMKEPVDKTHTMTLGEAKHLSRRSQQGKVSDPININSLDAAGWAAAASAATVRVTLEPIRKK